MLAQRRTLLATLFDAQPGPVATFASDIHEAAPPVFPEEEALIAGAASARLAEFRTGRACAHEALRALGVPAAPVLRGAQREPLWPVGIVGSITHTAGFCAAAAAPTQNYRVLGLDAELDRSVADDFVRRVCSPAEIARCAQLGPVERMASVVFSAKEAVHKLQYPLSREILYFRDLEVLLDPPHTSTGTFHARLLNPAPPFPKGTLFEGRWLREAGLILTGSALAAR